MNLKLNDALLPKYVYAKGTAETKSVSVPCGLGYNVFIKVETTVTNAVYIFVLDGGQVGSFASSARRDLAIKLSCTTANQLPLVRELTSWFARPGNNSVSSYNARALFLDGDDLSSIVTQGITTPITDIEIDIAASA